MQTLLTAGTRGHIGDYSVSVTFSSLHTATAWPLCRRQALDLLCFDTSCPSTVSISLSLSTPIQGDPRQNSKYRLKGDFREVMMGEGNEVSSVFMLTFTKMPGPNADTAWAVVR